MFSQHLALGRALLLAPSILFISTTSAQTTPWQDLVTGVSTTKSVGIGTTTPSEPLHVIGNAIAADPLLPQHLVTKKYSDEQHQTLQIKNEQQSAHILQLQQQIAQLQSQYVTVLTRLDDIDKTLSPTGKNCLDVKTQSALATSGFYIIDPDGADIGVNPFKVWCDMEYQGGGWTLYANHKDNIDNIQEGELISPNTFSVMRSDRWQALRKTVTGGMMFKDENGLITQVFQSKMAAANCRNIYTEDNLANLSTWGEYGLIWHHEDTNCDASWDFAGVILGDKDSTRFETYTYQGASVLQANNSKTRFDIWPYGNVQSSRDHQDELLYFVK